MSNPELAKVLALRPDQYWPEADTALFYHWLPQSLADQMMDAIRHGVDWQQHRVFLFGQWRDCPRLSAWYGDPGASYTYSGQALEPADWTPELADIRTKLFEAVGVDFNSVLLNRYRDGSDAMGWHSDNEASLGRNPLIASISLGAARKFSLRSRCKPRKYHHLELGHGSLLLMAGRCQHDWQHQLPRTRRPVGERINLTFRRVAS